jgi:hypothetical protein
VAIAAFNDRVMIVFALTDPNIPGGNCWPYRFAVRHRAGLRGLGVEEATERKRAGWQILSPDRGTADAIVSTSSSGRQKLQASVALLARARPPGNAAICGRRRTKSRTPATAAPLAKQVLSLPADVTVGWSDAKRW